MALFDHPIESTVGGIEIDLASAPLAPGAHRLKIDAGIGGIEIYVPSYVTFTFEGGPAIGGHDVHEGPGLWNKLAHGARKLVRLPGPIPVEAVPNPDPSQPISVHFVIDSLVGGVDVYRLPPRTHVPAARLSKKG